MEHQARRLKVRPQTFANMKLQLAGDPHTVEFHHRLQLSTARTMALPNTSITYFGQVCHSVESAEAFADNVIVHFKVKDEGSNASAAAMMQPMVACYARGESAAADVRLRRVP